MKKAIELSEKTVEAGNEPFGAVLVLNGEIVFTSENRINDKRDPTAHAEMELIRGFCEMSGVTDLREYTLYTNCEPCFMCSGAIAYAKVGRLVYAASHNDLEQILGKDGCECSKIVFDNSSFKPQMTAGVLKGDSVKVLKDYFSKRKKC